jgi:aminoglycoside phosphotransferase (APT) family kinase protein
MVTSDDLIQIQSFLRTAGWVEESVTVSFLAAGEYNANYLIDGDDSRWVLRINHGSQLGLGQKQIAYEFNILQALAETGVTPLPIACHPDPEPLGGGALLMSYLPGKALDYRQDLERAAGIFSKVHAVAVPEGLVVQADPVVDIARESEGLIDRFSDHPLKKERSLIQAYRDEVLEMADRTRSLFDGEALCLVNSEVNSGNFLISDQGAFLVDWEKAVESFDIKIWGIFWFPQRRCGRVMSF